MELFETIFPIILVALIGYLLAWKKIFAEKEIDAITKFVFNFSMPALLFIKTAESTLFDATIWPFLLSYYIPLGLVYIGAVFLGRYLFKYNSKNQSVFAMGSAYANTTIIGVPFTTFVLGEKALPLLFMLVSVHNIFIFTLGIFCAEHDSISTEALHKRILLLIKQLVFNPITGTLILGFLFNIFTIPIYKPLGESLSLIGKASIPTALFVMGASLNRYKIRGTIKPALAILTIKMIIFPLCVWYCAFQYFQLDHLWASTALLTASMPVGITAYIFAQQYKSSEATIATSIIISTVVSILTLSFVASYIGG